MIINAKKKTDPSPGDEKIVKLFALFPRRCEKDHYHWLETVEVLYKWIYAVGWITVVSDGNAAFHPEFPCICNQEKKIRKGLEVGKTYVCRNSDGNPFRKSNLYYTKIIAISGEYVQYIFVDENGENNIPYPTKWSNDIKSFNYCYKKKED